MDWQNYTIIGIVTLAFVFLLVRLARPKRSSKGCDHGCGCGKKENPNAVGASLTRRRHDSR